MHISLLPRFEAPQFVISCYSTILEEQIGPLGRLFRGARPGLASVQITAYPRKFHYCAIRYLGSAFIYFVIVRYQA
jgi:hypothetical protein